MAGSAPSTPWSKVAAKVPQHFSTPTARSRTISTTLRPTRRPCSGWWPDGTPRYTAIWKAGKLEGPSLEYFASGAKRSEAFYVGGKKDGPARTWDDQGVLLIEEPWKEDKLDGFVREFYPDGKLRLETTFREGKKNGPFKSLGADGSLATSGEFRDNKLSGSLLLHYPDANLLPNANTMETCSWVAGCFTRMEKFWVSLAPWRATRAR